MATRKQKEDLVETLKFSPGIFNIRCYGYGGEVVLGSVDREVYDYFVENETDLEEYSIQWASEDCEVPEDKRPFDPGEWYNCDNICHENGVEMSEHCKIEVRDPDDNVIWEHVLESCMLEDSGIEIDCYDEHYAEFQGSGNIVFFGQSIEKGTFFYADLELTTPFDPKKLKLNYVDVEGLELLSQVHYEDEEIYNDGGDTVGKSMEFKFLNTN